jgi:hypothetical protein
MKLLDGLLGDYQWYRILCGGIWYEVMIEEYSGSLDFMYTVEWLQIENLPSIAEYRILKTEDWLY